MIREFIVLFSIFSSGKKKTSSEFSPFEKSLSFKRLLSWIRTIIYHAFSFERVGISRIPFEIFLSINKDISPVLMLSVFVIIWLFPIWDDISKSTFEMFLAS